MSLVDILKSSIPKYQEKIPSSGKKIWFRPFLVKEEKTLLMSQETSDEIGVLKSIIEVVNSCFDNIPDAANMPIFDVEYLFLKLRSKSVQEIVTPILICPYTNEKIKLKINLDDIKVKTFKDHKQEINLSNNILLKMKYPTISLFMEYNIDRMELIDFYDLSVSCIEYIETKDNRILAKDTPKAELKEFVDNLTKQQFDEIIKFFATMPRIEHEVKYKTSDNQERSIVLRGIKDFFG